MRAGQASAHAPALIGIPTEVRRARPSYMHRANNSGGTPQLGFAVSLGAPFWFDLLSKVANIRSSLKPAEAKK